MPHISHSMWSLERTLFGIANGSIQYTPCVYRHVYLIRPWKWWHFRKHRHFIRQVVSECVTKSKSNIIYKSYLHKFAWHICLKGEPFVGLRLRVFTAHIRALCQVEYVFGEQNVQRYKRNKRYSTQKTIIKIIIIIITTKLGDTFRTIISFPRNISSFQQWYLGIKIFGVTNYLQ
jgi:hypothetical protein